MSQSGWQKEVVFVLSFNSTETFLFLAMGIAAIVCCIIGAIKKYRDRQQRLRAERSLDVDLDGGGRYRTTDDLFSRVQLRIIQCNDGRLVIDYRLGDAIGSDVSFSPPGKVIWRGMTTDRLPIGTDAYKAHWQVLLLQQQAQSFLGGRRLSS